MFSHVWLVVLMAAPGIETPAQRERLPLYQVTPAARPEELTPALGYPSEDGATDFHRRWDRSHGNDYNTRFSLLNQINQENVSRLKVAWTYRSADRKSNMVDNLQANPIVVDGVMYGPTVGHAIVALDAATGREKWRFDAGQRPAYRGLTYHHGAPDLLLFPAGASLWALNPATGKPVTSFGDQGRIRTGTSRVAPVVFEGLVIVSGQAKDVFAFDMKTGKRVWTFETIKDGFPTEGANAWGGIALDDQRGIVYFGTASLKPNFEGTQRPGDNLYADCLVAVDARTGKKVWHFQEVVHDIWDSDIPSPPVLVTIQRAGKQVDAVAAVSKTGNTLLLDRVTGKPLFPFRRRRAATSPVPGENTFAYQPDLELPQPFGKREATEDDVTNISPEAHKYIADKIRPMTKGWYAPFELGRPNLFYGVFGTGEWTGAAFDPRTGYLYINGNDIPNFVTIVPVDPTRERPKKLPPTAGEKTYVSLCAPCHGADRMGIGMGPPLIALYARTDDKAVTTLLETGRGGMPAAPPLTASQRQELLDFLFDRDFPRQPAPAGKRAATYSFLGFHRLEDPEGYPGSKPPWGSLTALDLSTGHIVWRTVLGEHEELTRRGVPKTGTLNMGGAIVTAGNLVFCSGTKDKMIRAFDAASGDELWKSELPFRGTAAPTTYEVRGKQYVVIASTGGGLLGGDLGDAYVAFALP